MIASRVVEVELIPTVTRKLALLYFFSHGFYEPRIHLAEKATPATSLENAELIPTNLPVKA